MMQCQMGRRVVEDRLWPDAPGVAGGPYPTGKLPGEPLRTAVWQIGPCPSQIEQRPVKHPPATMPKRKVQPYAGVGTRCPFAPTARMPPLEYPLIPRVDVGNQPVFFSGCAFNPAALPMDMINMHHRKAGNIAKASGQPRLSSAGLAYDHYSLHRVNDSQQYYTISPRCAGLARRLFGGLQPYEPTGLAVPETGIKAVFLQQLRMGSLLNDAARIHNDNPVHLRNRA